MADYNIYGDESCHLLNDGIKHMVLGALVCPKLSARRIADSIRHVKEKHNIPKRLEVKWKKVSPAKREFYLDLVDLFFDERELTFRAWVIADKTQLRHAEFGQDHDTWYFKMLFGLFEPLLIPKNAFRIFLDLKDTRSAAKVSKLHEVLCNNMYDFDREILQTLQVVRSDEIEQMQLADLLIGAVGYANRGLRGNSAKESILTKIQERSGYSMTRSTLLKEPKFNVFIWRPQGGGA